MVSVVINLADKKSFMYCGLLSSRGLEILQEIQLSNTRKNAFTDIAMKKILNSNLSAKYSLTGYLGK